MEKKGNLMFLFMNFYLNAFDFFSPILSFSLSLSRLLMEASKTKIFIYVFREMSFDDRSGEFQLLPLSNHTLMFDLLLLDLIRHKKPLLFLFSINAVFISFKRRKKKKMRFPREACSTKYNLRHLRN